MNETTNMLRPKALNKILASVNTGGVNCTLLLNKEGSLLAYAGGTSDDWVKIAALASTLWKNYQRCGNSVFQEDKLKKAVIQSDEVNMVVRSLSSVLLCICSNQTVPLGMLMHKADTVAKCIENSLDKILLALP